MSDKLPAAEIKRVKVSHFIESQIPQFLNEESPLFKEFLEQYVYSQEHQGGVEDLATNLPNYKRIAAFNNETLIPYTALTQYIFPGDDTINVTSTRGWPDSYGLLKIDNEIITYTSKTETSFLGCARGFSGIDQISREDASEFLNFGQTEANEHQAGQLVYNLSNLFLQKFFEKFKSEFLPGFENRSFISGANVSTILSRAKDFYASKGTDQSYQILFKLLYGKDIDIIKPIDYTLIPSSNSYFRTKNILVENLFEGNPLDTVGNSLEQNIPGIGTVSASIYNVEYRPVDDKNFYEISLDSTSFTGNFQVPGKTRTLEIIGQNSDNILVDSTVGFAQAGTLLIKPTAESNFIEVSYTDKTINQFTGVTGVTTSLEFGASIFEDRLAYTYSGFGQTSLVQLRLVNIIDDVDTTQTANMQVGDNLKLYSFGFDLAEDAKFNSWIYNLPTTHNISNFAQVSSNNYRITLFDNVVFYVDEEIRIVNDLGQESTAVIKTIEYDSSNTEKKLADQIVVQSVNAPPTNPSYIKKKIVKSSHNSNYFSGLDSFPIGIQNSYLDKNEDYAYVTASGLPNYPVFATDNKVFVKSSTVEAVDSNNTPINDGGFTYTLRSLDPAALTPFNHNLVTGDKIYWDNTTNSGIQTGVYFVTSINETEFFLSYSGSDVFAKKYIAVRTGTSGQYIFKNEFQNKTLKHQKILRKFPYQKKKEYFIDENKKKINNKPVGLLANGVEIYPPTVFDEQIFFGNIEEIKVTNPGKGYDIINGPPLIITDDTGSGARAHANLVGSFDQVKLITPGIGYQEKPKITVTGGNGTGAVLESNFVRGRIIANFRADGSSVNVASNTIDFPEKHNFQVGEGIIYESQGNPPIGNLVSGSTYFARPVDLFTISLHQDSNDAITGSNPVNIGSVSFGFHRFSTLEAKNTITKIYVKNPGEGYSNRKIIVPSRPTSGDIQSGISTSDNYIFARNHRFETGDVVEYRTTGSIINGLTTTSNYAVRKLDDNKFKLYDVGVSTQRDFVNFEKNKEVILKSVGTGDHTIKYPDIVVKVESISALGSTTIVQPQFEPIVLGSIDSVYLQEGGIGYGCTNIIDFHRRPYVGVSTVRFNALLKPIIIGGSIVDVQILASGEGYRQDSDIVITSDNGDFADIKPIITDNKITGVTILDGGIGYDSSTVLTLQNRGRDAKFIASLKEWKINQVEKQGSLISREDAIVIRPNTDPDLGLQAVSMYPPSRLRYQLGDNIDNGNLELTQNAAHSPIMGWAYDGNPIYGPYGFSGTTGGPVRRLTPGYILNTQNLVNLRPPGYALGYFINDYVFNNSGDLDEFGGRYCVTPQYPDGTYAYFYSVDVDSSGVAEPKYPYLLGPSFKDLPEEENFFVNFNQDFPVVDRGLVRNIGPYYLSAGNSDYELIDKVKDSYKQEFNVTSVKSAGITSVSIFSPGTGYKVGDSLLLDNTGTDGTGSNIVVEEVVGKLVGSVKVGVDTFVDTDLQLINNRIVAITTVPHGIENGETIFLSGISTSQFTDFDGPQKVSVFSRVVGLTTFIPDVGATGITTHILVTDTRGFNSGDIIGIGTETMTVIDVDPKYNRLRVNREYYIGIAVTHTAGDDKVQLKPTKFEFGLGDSDISYRTFSNEIVYFDPNNTVGTGTTGATYQIIVGLGGTLSSNVGHRVVPQQAIFLPDHKFYTGQKVIYNVGVGGSSLAWSPTGSGSTTGIGTELLVNESELYAVNIGPNFLGLSTVGFPTSGDAVHWYDPIGNDLGFAHSIRTTAPKVTSTVERFFGEVTTDSDHELVTGDKVKLSALPLQTETVSLRYDPFIAKTTGPKVEFEYTDFSADLTQFLISDSSFKSGDKVVFYSGNFTVGGLVDNETYFVLREDPRYIKLCKYKSDVIAGNPIVPTSVQNGGTFSIAKINPPFTFTNGNQITFDVSDSSLGEMELRFFEDLTFIDGLDTTGTEDGFAVSRDGVPGNLGATVKINTRLGYPRKSFYKLVPLVPADERKRFGSSDIEVTGRNSITLNNIVVDDKHSIIRVDEKKFNFNLLKRPSRDEFFTNVAGITTIFYQTNSSNTTGSIAKIKINFPGKGYTVLPKVTGFATTEGKNAVVKIYSDTIGEIDTLERVKDGFDYPTDPTLLPFLSVPAIVDVSGIARIKSVDVTDGGVNYTQPPKLIVRGNSNVELSAHVNGGAVSRVDILKNSFEFDEPLSVITVKNSNGFDIDAITHSGTDVTVELLLDPQFNIPVSNGYASTGITFPFAVGDKVFIEDCRITPNSQNNGELNFNSENFDYSFFTVTGINTVNYTITYSVAGIATGTLGEYDDDFTLGSIVNFRDMAKFEMKLIDDAKFLSGEKVTAKKFEGIVAENGWNPKLSQLRLRDTFGTLSVGEVIEGQETKLRADVKDVNRFNVRSNTGASRDKLVKGDLNTGILNDFLQRIADNEYYQKFSYSIKSDIPYEKWKESVRAIVHPSGFKEFSDLELMSEPTINEVNAGIAKSTNMRIKAVDTKIDTIVNIDQDIFLGKRENFAMITEDDPLPDGSVQRIFFPEGRPIKSFILNKTNKVLKLDDISDGFTGQHNRAGVLEGKIDFKLTSGGRPVFKIDFNSASSTVVDIPNNIITFQNHNFQTGQELIYDTNGGDSIGIATTSHISGLRDIVMNVTTSGTGSSAMYENGYNNTVIGPVTGIGTTVSPITTFKVYGFGNPLPSTTNGNGDGATFLVQFVYDQSTGQPLSTSVQLIAGGSGYDVGDTVTIGGTYLGGAAVTNDLSFPVNVVTGTRTGILTTYSNLPSTNDGGGSGATFNVTRDANLDIESVEVVTGGSGYASTNRISIAGTYIGGISPDDDLFLTPTELGGTTIPSRVYVQKLDDTKFRLSGLSTSLPMDFVGLGTGTHTLKYAEPTKNALIMIDNIIQSPLANKRLNVGVGSAVGLDDQAIVISSGIGSIAKGDIIKIDDEFVQVESIGDSTFVKSRTAAAQNTVDNNFYYDTNRMNSTVRFHSNSLITHDDNPPY